MSSDYLVFVSPPTSRARSRCLGWGLILFSFAVGAAPFPWGSQPWGARIFAADLTADQLQDLWRKRAAQSDPLLVEWTEQRSHPLATARVNAEPPDGSADALRRRTIKAAPSSLLVHGELGRRKGAILRARDGEFVGWSGMELAFDGSESRSLKAGLSGEPSRGTIENSSEFDEWKTITVKPILIVYRTLEQNVITRDPFTMSVEPEREMIDGTSCQVVRFRMPGPARGAATLWIDPERAALPLRCTKSIQDRVLCDYSFRYGGEGADRERLIGWQVTCFSDDGDDVTDSIEATEVAVTWQPAVQPSDFVIDFPPGSIVMDLRGSTPSKLVSEGNGVFRAFGPGDESLADRRWLWWGAGGIALIAVVLLLRLRSQRIAA
ncbi:MAG: hypothetical protein WD872_15705 [Pirellulaceae bacterium]